MLKALSIYKSPFEELLSDFMVLSTSRCEELVAPRCGAPQAARDDAGARDKAILRVVLQPVQASSSGSTDAPHRSTPSSSPDHDCKTMKSFDNSSNGL